VDIRVFTDADAVALEAAGLIASMARQTIADHGRFIMAVSGGKTPWRMLQALAFEDVPWNGLYVVQTDERVAPAGHADRNLTHLRESLLSHTPLKENHIYEMPVESGDLESAAIAYSATLGKIAGIPPVLDLVHLGLGSDGHTASLVPGDPVLNVDDHDVAITGIYQGRKRMTLTYPIINRARNILWIITGAEKAPMLNRLQDADSSIPAGRIRQEAAIIMADTGAAGDMFLK
jgi:6-phosphogluconolactonase